MITAIYFLLLLAASVEDYRSHKVSGCRVAAVWLLGIIHIAMEKENRWVTVALTCVCFIVLLLLYWFIRRAAERKKQELRFGGADVRLIPAMMLVQGWDRALTGVLSGLLAAAVYHLAPDRRKKEIPLVPWMTAGCFLLEIIYLFS